MTEGYDSPSSESRALVVISPEPANDNRAHRHHRARRVAAFVTQLIANAHQVPQTCEKRRAEPNEVIAAYRETMEKIQKLNTTAS